MVWLLLSWGGPNGPNTVQRQLSLLKFCSQYGQLCLRKQHLGYTQLLWIVKTSQTTMFLWQPAWSWKGKMKRRPPLRFTSPHTLNSLIFPLDTAKNHRLNSIAYQYYWQRLFMQLTAQYLSHSLLASILICAREREVSDGGQRGMRRGRQRESERYRPIQRGTQRVRTGRAGNLTEKVLVFIAAKSSAWQEDKWGNICVLTSLWRNTVTKQTDRRAMRGTRGKKRAAWCDFDDKQIGKEEDREKERCKGSEGGEKIVEKISAWSHPTITKTCIIIDLSQQIPPLSLPLPLPSSVFLSLLCPFFSPKVRRSGERRRSLWANRKQLIISAIIPCVCVCVCTQATYPQNLFNTAGVIW